MVNFVDLKNQAQSVKDAILSEMMFNDSSAARAAGEFQQHFECTKNWFIRVSWANKKRFLLALADQAGPRAISLVLQATWSSWSKDAVLSISTCPPTCGYDQVPMDNNRTALPISLLKQVMQAEVKWFISLCQDSQSAVILELLSVSGGPLVWEALKKCREIHEHQWASRDESTQAQDSDVNGSDHLDDVRKKTKSGKMKPSAQRLAKSNNSANTVNVTDQPIAEAETELQARLAAWETLLRAARAKLNMEEVETAAADGGRRAVWRVATRRPEPAETVDYIQLLPAPLAKYIFCYLPRASFPDYARVNKYWAYLIEDLKAENAVRLRIDQDIAKFNVMFSKNRLMTNQDILLRNAVTDISNVSVGSPVLNLELKTSLSRLQTQEYMRRRPMPVGLTKKRKPPNPVRKLSELNERLERRGAADEDVFWWCQNILRRGYEAQQVSSEVASTAGITNIELGHFPCPLLRKTVKIPLEPPLYKNPLARCDYFDI